MESYSVVVAAVALQALPAGILQRTKRGNARKEAEAIPPLVATLSDAVTFLEIHRGRIKRLLKEYAEFAPNNLEVAELRVAYLMVDQADLVRKELDEARQRFAVIAGGGVGDLKGEAQKLYDFMTSLTYPGKVHDTSCLTRIVAQGRWTFPLVNQPPKPKK